MMKGHKSTLAAVLATCVVAMSAVPAWAESSMRIEVEVYKGPLSKEPEVQWAELYGLIREIPETTRTSAGYICHVAISRNLVAGSNSLCGDLLRIGKFPQQLVEDLPAKCERLEDTEERIGCAVIAKLASELKDTHDRAQTLGERMFCTGHALRGGRFVDVAERNAPPVCGTTSELLVPSQTGSVETRRTITAQLLADASGFSSRLRTRAFTWSNTQVGFPAPKYDIRGVVVGYANLLAEYGNQIQARADALLKQLNGTDRRRVPVSVLLRDTSPTQFVHQYERLGATYPNIQVLLESITPSHADYDNLKDRTKGYELLFDDHNWTRINTAYASGAGKTQMAFVKDDIGNWNLKQFDNDASELLQAYTGLATASIGTAANIVKSAMSGGSTAAVDSLLNVANKVAFGSSGTVLPAGLDPTALHQFTSQRLLALKEEASKKESQLSATDKADYRNTVATKVTAILSEHEQMLDTMFKTASMR
ncbi:MAG: hypothetical protein ABT940_01800 [Alphaproteobacteria bacterium]